MPKLPILRLRNSEPPSRPDLQYYGITLAFSDLKLGRRQSSLRRCSLAR